MINRYSNSSKICPKFPPIPMPVQIPSQDGKLIMGTEMRPVLCFHGGCAWFCDEHQMCCVKCKYLHEAEFCGPFECFDDDGDGNKPEV